MLDAVVIPAAAPASPAAVDLLPAAVRAVLAPLSVGADAAGRGRGGVAATAAQVRAGLPLALLLSLLAGASTGLGGLLMVSQEAQSARRLGLWQGAAAGFMAAVCGVELLPSAAAELAWGVVAFYVAVGGGLFLLLRRLIPEPDLEAFTARPASGGSTGASGLGVAPAKSEPAVARKVLLSGYVSAVGIFVHNLPEGMAVGLSSLRGLRVSLPLACAISLHNIPEGAIIATPVYYATQDKWYAVRLAFYSGLAEPLGVLVCYALLEFTGVVLSSGAVAAMLAAVAGVMLCICLVELVPQAKEHAGAVDAYVATGAGLVAMTMLWGTIDLLGIEGH